MSKRDDVNMLYNCSKEMEKYCKYLFWGNCIISLVSTTCTGQLKNILILGQIIGSFLFVVFKSIDDGAFWYNAEMARRKNSIQLAFNLPLSELETDGYYNNSIKPSITKYAVNTFESNFFSKFIAGKMLMKSTLKALLSIVILIITSWIISDGDILLIITQTVFSAYVIEDTIMLAIYKLKMDKLYDEAFSEFITIGIKDKKQKIWLLSYAIEYEAVKAHYKVRLDSNLFSTYNPELSRKWDTIQQKISVVTQEKVL